VPDVPRPPFDRLRASVHGEPVEPARGELVEPRAFRVARADRRFAWWLVWLYPPAFRRDVGLGLVDALDDRMRARRADGASLAGVRLPALADTVRNAPVEWMATVPVSVVSGFSRTMS